VGSRFIRVGPDQDLSRLTQPLETRGHVHGVAEGRVAAGAAAREHTGYHGPGVDPYAEAERVVPLDHPGLLFVGPPSEGRLHVQRGSQGPLFLVLVGDRRAKQSHHAVADELVHVATPAGDAVAERPQAAGNQLVDLFRVQFLGERREALQVREQHRDLAALRVGHSAEVRPAVAAESGAGRVGLVTGRTRNRVAVRQRGSAVCAVPGVRRDDGRAGGTDASAAFLLLHGLVLLREQV
jgi:hypothetical protein